MPTNQRKPLVIFDTDPGKDDAIAFLLLSAWNNAKIVAVTTVAGNGTIQEVTNNARSMINLTEEVTPLYSGSPAPLKKKLTTANIHGKQRLIEPNNQKNESLDNIASNRIVEIVNNNPGDVNIVAIAPLTNIASAFAKDSSLPKKIKQLIIMGGAITEPGNKNRVAEFNISVDPHAAKIVFDSGANITLVPLDICYQIPLFMEDFQKLKPSKYYQPIITMMKDYIKAIKKFEGKDGAIVYDALAVYYLINPQAFTTQKMDIRIETKGELTQGMTVADRRPWGEHNLNVNVTTTLDRNIFLKEFTIILNSVN